MLNTLIRIGGNLNLKIETRENFEQDEGNVYIFFFQLILALGKILVMGTNE